MRNSSGGGFQVVATAQLAPVPDVEMSEITVADTALALVGEAGIEALDAKTTVVVVQIEAATVRFTDDGTDPVATTHGFRAYDGQTLIWSVATAARARFVREGGTSAKLKVGQYKHST